MRPALLAALALLLLAPAASAEIWRWTDAEGITRYTPDPGRVPSDRRGSLVAVKPGLPPSAAAAPTEQPGYTAPADEVDSDPFNAPQRARSIEVTEVPEPAWEVDTGPREPTPSAAATAPGAVTPDTGAPDLPTAGAAAATSGAAGALPGAAAATSGAAGATSPTPDATVTTPPADPERDALADAPPPVSSPPPEPEVPADDREETTLAAARTGSAAATPTATAGAGSAAAAATTGAATGAAAATTAGAATGAAAATTAGAATGAAAATTAGAATGAAAATPGAATGAAATTAGAAAATTAAAGASGGIDPWSSVALGGAPVPTPEPQPAPLTPEQVSRRDELEELIAEDEAALKRLLSDTELDASGFEQSPELREIAARLPALQAELRALEDGRAPEAEEAP
jgi:hypothetical protein